MCVDFMDLNKACPKDSYPLPNIDALVDNAFGCRLLSFLDAFSSYNQIMMHPRDECKKAFITELSCYCYKVMPFILKNAGATYQQLMDRVLKPMLGRNVQVYIDDMVVTSQQKGMEEGQASLQLKANHHVILGQSLGTWLESLKRIGTLLLMAERPTSTCYKKPSFC